MAKTISFGAAHTYMAYIRGYTLPSPLGKSYTERTEVETTILRSQLGIERRTSRTEGRVLPARANRCPSWQ